jgi:tRNA-2-methylthio-N6-dimethylallyladenosine synthase
MEIIEYIRSKSRDISLTTDLIVGFPSETEEEYEDTLKIVKEVGYDAAFMFRYSIRPGTKAAEIEDDVAEEDKIRRLKKLIALQQQISYECNQREAGKVRTALVEGTSRRNDEEMRARTDNNKIVLFEADQFTTGKILPVKINSADAFTLHGELMVS